MDKKYKVDYFTLDGSGKNALHYLCQNKMKELFRVGLKYVKDCNSEESKSDQNEAEGEGSDDDHKNKDLDQMYDCNRLKHVKAHQYGWNMYQDELIKVAEYLTKGISFKSKCDKSDVAKLIQSSEKLSYFILAVDNGNYGLANWFVEKGISVPKDTDFDRYIKEDADDNIFNKFNDRSEM